jgi:hypothetical protein
MILDTPTPETLLSSSSLLEDTMRVLRKKFLFVAAAADTLLNYITQKNYGPYTGWSAKGLSVDTGTGSGFRIIWRHTGGSVAVSTDHTAMVPSEYLPKHV